MAYDTDDFATDVIQRSHTVPVLVDFWAEWCGPCKVLGPVLERLADQSHGEWELVKLNTENHQDIAGQYSIRSIPNVKLFVDGKVVDEFVGALPEPRVIEWLRTAIPSKYQPQLADARQLLIENGANVNGQDGEGITALMLSGDEGRTEIASILIEQNAYVNLQSNNGTTALMEAAFEGRTDTVKLLLKNGANPGLSDRYGRTALLGARQEGYDDIVELLERASP